MTIVNLDIINFPKYCALDKIKSDSRRFVEYYEKAKGRKPDRLPIDIVYSKHWNKAIKANDDLYMRFGDKPEFILFGLPVEFV